MSECSNCARPVHDGADICTRCTAGLAEKLRGVPELVDDLQVTLTKQDRLTTGGGRGAGELPLPVRLDIPDAIWALGNVVTTWAREVADANGLRIDPRQVGRPIRGHVEIAPVAHMSTRRCDHSDLPIDMCAHCRGHQLADAAPDERVTVLHQPVAPVIGWRPPTALDSLRFAAGWLADHIGQLRTLIDAQAAHDEITDAIAAAGKACGALPLRVFVGPCDVCQVDLFAPPDATSTRCPLCGTAHHDLPTRWAALVASLREQVATAAEIARTIGSVCGVIVKRLTITQWYHRGQLDAVHWVPREGDGDGPRFLVGDVLDRATRSRSKAGA